MVHQNKHEDSLPRSRQRWISFEFRSSEADTLKDNKLQQKTSPKAGRWLRGDGQDNSRVNVGSKSALAKGLC